MDGAPVEYDPLLLPDIEPALRRLRRAIAEKELIAVYGDFDVDGVTASAILIEGMASLGGRVVSYIPDRAGEGYGVNAEAIGGLRARGVSLIVTADCGTSSVAEVEQARRLGIEVIVLDHHSVPARLPDAVAVVNPKRPENRYPDPELASGGLALKLMAALHEAMGRPWEASRYIDLAALSTVCDVAPLQNENRWIVKEGLRALGRTSRPGLRALIEASGMDSAYLDADSIAYALGPRLNAAGRLAHARLALELLLERDYEEAARRALQLSELNRQRQEATAAAIGLAQQLLTAEDAALPLIFIGHRDIPAGIVGLVAGRLADELYRPAVVYQEMQETSRASCRSIPEFDITGALRAAPEGLMLRFGGHRAAAGFTAENHKLPLLREALLEQATRELAGVDLAPVLDIDAAVSLERMNGRLIQLIFKLGPFGCANPEPAFLSRGLEVADVRLMGDEGAHLRLKLRDGRVTWPAVWFNGPSGGGNPPPAGDRMDAVYSFSRDKGAEGGLELRIRDMRRAEPD
jgi:single-stranded-DNA-specific exonuclease